MSKDGDKIEQLHQKVDTMGEDIAWIKGTLQARDNSSRDWWTRLIAIGAALLAFFK